ncbi:hypothetical protein I4U23_010872 [Adineta vaga]|nr:hypothetical protein I4U23_010872 [Adineta vaga]
MKRLANRIPTHPLLGVRQLTGQMDPTWRSLININLPEYAFLKDHKIQDAILFPAVAFLELATAACHQLLSSSTINAKQPTIIFEQVKFVKALILTEHELTEIFTKINMPMREWNIYSRPWSGAGSDCMRTSGMLGTDVIDSFLDQEKLSEYSLKQFTLHAYGRIEIDNNNQQKIKIPSHVNLTHNIWSTNEPINIYTHLSTRGYQYGSLFQNIESLHGTTSKVNAIINHKNSNEINNLSSYYLIHPSLLDACLHPLLALLPDNETTFLPISIDKFITQNKSNHNLSSYTNVEMRASYYDDVYGLSVEKTYTADLVVTPNGMKIEDSVCIFQGFSIQQVQGIQSGQWTLEKSIFDKLNSITDLPNKNHDEYLDIIMKDYCMQRIWDESVLIKNIAYLFPSPNQLILNANINTVSHQDLIDSIKPFNELAACYAQLVLKDLDISVIDQQYYPLLNACQSLALYVHNKQITEHSIQLRLLQLYKQFPRLKPLLIALNNYGSQLKDIFYGKQTGTDVFLGNKETEHTFQQIKTILSLIKTQQIFHIIFQYLLQFQQNNNITNSLNNYHLHILCLSTKTHLWIDLHYINTDSEQLAQAKQVFQKYLDDHQSTHIFITYDHTINVFNSKTFEKIPVETFDIIFAANQFQGSDEEDLIESLINLRHLLIPNGLFVLLELTNEIPAYFDLIFGLLDQWWSLTTDNTRSINNIQQWITILEEIGGLSNIQPISSQYESTIIVCQKTKSNEILETLNERKNQAWVLFTNDNDQSFGLSLKSFLPCSNVRVFDMCNTTLEIIRSAIEVIIKTYKQVYIIFAWSLEQILLDINNNNDKNNLAFKQQEETICGTMSLLLQTIQTISPDFYPFVYVITYNAQLNLNFNCNLITSPLIGLVRSLVTEYERNRLKLIDLQAPSLTLINQPIFIQTLIQYMIDSRSSNKACEIVLKFDTNQNQNQIKYITWHYEMLQQVNDDNLEMNKLEAIPIIPQQDADQHPFRLCVPTSRFLADLTWIKENRIHELPPGKIEVRIHSVGINFRDVLKARGLYPHTRIFAQSDQDQPLVNRDTEPGSDFVGTVVRACPTTKYQVGDNILGISTDGVFHSHVIVDSINIIRIPAECPLTYEQLSGMPVPCMTVIYSLKYRANLHRNQTILIHAATGAAGQMCIQYCQLIGARIIATAGTEEKRRFLREYYGIEHVFNSRNMSFVDDILHILPNGVDIIVNSLSGSLLKESMKLLAYHGHFIEWGKRDIFDNNDEMFSSDVCNHGTILISGGFGGLGLTMSRWMIEKRGVKHIALMSRRTLIELEQPSNPQYNDWLRLKQTINKYHAQVDVVQVDVTNFQQVYNLIEKFNQTSYPVRGIIHSAVVSEDRSLYNLTQDYFSRVLPAKVRGAWNLHQATQLTHTPIHFFIMFSSIRNHLLDISSGGYNAGNQFLDTLANYRMKELNLPALSISLPAVSGAGMFHRHRDTLITLKMAEGFDMVPTISVFELIERIHKYKYISSYPVIFAVNWKLLYKNRHNLATSYLTEIVEKRSLAMKLNDILSSSEINKTNDFDYNRKETIIERIQKTVTRLLGASTNDHILIDKSLISQGMDSLAAISLYNWLGQETSIFIPIADLLQGLSIESIATLVYDKLHTRRQQVTSSNTKESDTDIDIINENDIKLSTNSTFTGIDNVICLQKSQQNSSSSIYFCIIDTARNANIDNLSKFFISKLSSKTIYMLQMPSITESSSTNIISACAQELISQMRRIQPLGPYQLVAIQKHQEENIANAMLEQLKTHSGIVDAQLFLLNDQN